MSQGGIRMSEETKEAMGVTTPVRRQLDIFITEWIGQIPAKRRTTLYELIDALERDTFGRGYLMGARDGARW